MDGTAYVYDEDGYYIGPTPVQESPLEPGLWLIPGACTMTPLPELVDGEQARWDGEAWIVEQAT